MLVATYIFLNKDSQNHNITLFINRIKDYFSNIEKKENEKQYIYKHCYSISSHTNYLFNFYTKENDYYLDIYINSRINANIINDLEKINKIFCNDSTLNKNYYIILSYDKISEYYCNNLYPYLNEFERNLKNILFNIYILKYGYNYYNGIIPNEIIEKSKKLNHGDNQLIRNFFYALDLGDVQSLLFNERRKDNYLQELNQIIFDDNLWKNQSKDNIKNKIKDTLEINSDWNRYFSKYIKIANINQNIDTIRDTRNTVAHCKFFGKEDYDFSKKIIIKTNAALIKAIELIRKKNFNQSIPGLLNSLQLLEDALAKYKETYLQEGLKNLFEIFRQIGSIAVKNLSNCDLSNRSFDNYIIPDDDSNK